MYILAYSEHVISNDIKKLSTPIKKLIQATIEHKLLLDPIKFGKPLRYSFKNCRSLRVGDYRVIYQLHRYYNQYISYSTSQRLLWLALPLLCGQYLHS